MPRRKEEEVPQAYRVPTPEEEEEGRRKLAEALAAVLESPYCPRDLSDRIEDHVIKLSEMTHHYIFAPEVVRVAYPLMCRRGVEMAVEREEREEEERRRQRRERRAAKSKPDAETDSVN